MKQYKLAAVVLFVAAQACTTVDVPTLADSTVPFSPAEVTWARQPGNNTISGNALLRTVGGEVRTCAGFSAQLIPVTPYGEDRMQIIYGSPNGGFNSLSSPRIIADAKPEYLANALETSCDSLGNFEFRNLPDGAYFVSTQVSWGIPHQYFTRTEGGIIAKRVEVSGGETVKVVLTN